MRVHSEMTYSPGQRVADQETIRRMPEVFAVQRRAADEDGFPGAKIRIDRIQRLIDLLMAHSDTFAETLNLDFAVRSPVQSVLTDILGILPSLKHDLNNLSHWMRPKKVSARHLELFGARARIEWVPRGVVGIISPWNFPIGLAFQPLSQAFAAGNRAMLKLSEFTPNTSALMACLISDYYDESEVAVINGGPDIAAAFTKIPFDLMFFTGATKIARHVQRACADNLVPCVLELGGKSPVVIADNADFKKAARSIAAGKTLNAGQICLAPDYVFVPNGREREFADVIKSVFEEMLDSILDNEDYTSIISRDHFERLAAHISDARAKGAEIIQINPANEDFSNQVANKMPPTLILGARNGMTVLAEEIFGPLLPIMGYSSIADAAAYIRAHPRPLATYYFGKDDRDCRYYLDHTVSGGVTINDVALHAAIENLPFGGIGESGMGYYHGRTGFETMSHPRGILRAGLLSPMKLMAGPYGPRTRKFILRSLSREKEKAEKRIARRRAQS